MNVAGEKTHLDFFNARNYYELSTRSRIATKKLFRKKNEKKRHKFQHKTRKLQVYLVIISIKQRDRVLLKPSSHLVLPTWTFTGDTPTRRYVCMRI